MLFEYTYQTIVMIKRATKTIFALILRLLIDGGK